MTYESNKVRAELSDGSSDTVPTGRITDSVQEAEVDRRYLDHDRSVGERVEILLKQMSIEEKAGLMFHTMLMPGPGGEIAEGNSAFGLAGAAQLIDRGMSHFNILGSAGSSVELARWHNRLQELALGTRLGIPVTLSTDPRHSFTENPGTAAMAGAFSQWPEPLGLAAIGDQDLVQRFADIVRAEYLAVGIRLALHPQIDIATEPRWARQVATFGEDVETTSRLAAAYVRGLQGSEKNGQSVAAMVKHFPGAGPQLGGEDAHFAYGREQVYPGGQFDLHLQPFIAALAAGAGQVMPYYAMPVGAELEEVGFSFNRSIVTDLLRTRLGFDGIVCTDWGLLSDGHMMGEVFPARAWGVEDLTVPERMKKAIDAGVDQFGGEDIPGVLVELVRGGEVPEDRIDQSARRLLKEKFQLGLFDTPFVEAEKAGSIVGCADYRAAGEAAQRAAVTVLKNENSATDRAKPVLPATRGIRIYVEGIDEATARAYGTVVSDPADADLAIIRLVAPFEARPGTFERFFHAGSLDFAQDTVDHVRAIAEAVPTVLDVFLDRPAILTPLIDDAAGVLVNFGASSAALLDVVFGDAEPRGRLPFDLPRSMRAVEASREDVPFDTEHPLFRFGDGLKLGRP